MALDGTEGTWITLDDGAAYAAEWRTENPSARKAMFFGKDKLQTLLDASGSVGIRIYMGLDAAKEIEMVLVAADSAGDDLLDNILDGGIPCPSNCSQANELNS